MPQHAPRCPCRTAESTRRVLYWMQRVVVAGRVLQRSVHASSCSVVVAGRVHAPPHAVTRMVRRGAGQVFKHARARFPTVGTPRPCSPRAAPGPPRPGCRPGPHRERWRAIGQRILLPRGDTGGPAEDTDTGCPAEDTDTGCPAEDTDTGCPAWIEKEDTGCVAMPRVAMPRVAMRVGRVASWDGWGGGCA